MAVLVPLVDKYMDGRLVGILGPVGWMSLSLDKRVDLLKLFGQLEGYAY